MTSNFVKEYTPTKSFWISNNFLGYIINFSRDKFYGQTEIMASEVQLHWFF